MMPNDKMRKLVLEVFRLWKKKDSKQSDLPFIKQKPSEPQQLSFGLPYKDVNKLPVGQLPLDISSPSYLSIEELKKRMKRSPFYQDPKKWRKDNFKGGKEYRDDQIWEEDPTDPIIYIGPDLSKYGFDINGQKMKPMEKVNYELILVSDLLAHMNQWNYALAVKMGIAPKPSYA